MKVLASLFTLPLFLSSCGTTKVEEKQIQPLQERKNIVRDIDIETLDITKPSVVTYVYIITDKAGKLVFLGENRGYDITKDTREGVWINMKNPRTDEMRPVLVHNNIIVSSFRLDQ